MLRILSLVFFLFVVASSGPWAQAKYGTDKDVQELSVIDDQVAHLNAEANNFVEKGNAIKPDIYYRGTNARADALETKLNFYSDAYNKRLKAFNLLQRKSEILEKKAYPSSN